MNRSIGLAGVGTAAVFLMFAPREALAQEPVVGSPTGKVDGPTALVKGPGAPGSVPTIEAPKDSVRTVTLSAGGSWLSGNSKLLAGTLNGQAEQKVGDNSVGAQVLGNYGRGAPAGEASKTSASNVQGRVRYDRFLSERLTVFGMFTGRTDHLQGLDFRLNVDPGVKYIVVKQESYALWGELGYDLQHDIRWDNARYVLAKDASGAPIKLADGTPVGVEDPGNPGHVQLIDKTFTDHSARVFVGYRHAFNKEVTAQTGLEYLQSFRDSGRYRLNFDALLAAKLFDGFSFGMGFTARYDHAPIGDKQTLDTSLVGTLIYAFSDAKPPPPAEPTCPCLVSPSAPLRSGPKGAAEVPAPQVAPAPVAPPPGGVTPPGSTPTTAPPHAN